MNEREFWILIRRALLMVLRAIEKRWGIASKYDDSLDDDP